MPVKEKTMLIIGIINELQQVARFGKSSVTEVLSYFLCQGTDSRLNTATAVLRGIIYLLASQQPFLISHLRKKYDYAGRKLFGDNSAFYSLSDVFRQMVQEMLSMSVRWDCHSFWISLLDSVSTTHLR